MPLFSGNKEIEEKNIFGKKEAFKFNPVKIIQRKASTSQLPNFASATRTTSKKLEKIKKIKENKPYQINNDTSVHMYNSAGESEKDDFEMESISRDSELFPKRQNSPQITSKRDKYSLMDSDSDSSFSSYLKKSVDSHNSEDSDAEIKNFLSNSNINLHIENFVITKQTYLILKIPEIRTIAPNQEGVLYKRQQSKFEIEEKHESENFKYIGRHSV
mmetsp:Transcript_22013/g.19567  ORF Transcript_22013/g.19567 Transcript_22013/m.19567 type:complete len:216 (-) Transcript_22013:62-709(-)